MKKQTLILFLTLLLLTLCFSGCFGNNDNNNGNDKNAELDRFIGTWTGWVFFNSSIETWTFYENRSIYIDDSFGRGCGTYSLDDSDLEVKIPMPSEEHPDAVQTSWYDYKFSENDTHLTFYKNFGSNEGELFGELDKE